MPQKALSILLAEDDPIAREVVVAHLRALGCQVTSTAAASQAIALASSTRFDALLFDCELSDGNAASVLSALRNQASCPNAQTLAIAMSAELTDMRFDGLMNAGFSDALEKPIIRSRLHQALLLGGILDDHADIAAHAPENVNRALPVLDDEAGLSACGNAEVLKGLRSLLVQELSTYRTEIVSACAREDRVAFKACVHRAKSALGFCGAAELKAMLELGGNNLPSTEQLADWEAAIDRLARALIAPNS